MLEKVDLIAGGFPCTDISNAGKRAGLAGANSGLWREMRDTIRLVRPRFALVENVAALLNRGMGEVLGDLAESGYDSEWDCLPAGTLGAPHVRDMVFIIAHAERLRWERERPKKIQEWGRKKLEGLVSRELQLCVPTRSNSGIHDGIRNRVHRLRGLGNAVYPDCAELIGKQIISNMG